MEGIAVDELHDNVANGVAFTEREITSFLPEIMHQWYGNAAVLCCKYHIACLMYLDFSTIFDNNIFGDAGHPDAIDSVSIVVELWRLAQDLDYLVA